jgi:hypothetical protein
MEPKSLQWGSMVVMMITPGDEVEPKTNLIGFRR